MENIKIYRYPHGIGRKNSDNEIIASVKKYLGDTNADISVQRDEYGKPHVVGADGIYVSVTHHDDRKSGEGLCLVAVSDREIGIDIERADRTVANPMSVARRYFCPDEISFLESHPYPEAFNDMWVKKEALSKLIGRGVPAMDEKSIFSDDLEFVRIADCDGYISYYVYYKD